MPLIEEQLHEKNIITAVQGARKLICFRYCFLHQTLKQAYLKNKRLTNQKNVHLIARVIDALREVTYQLFFLILFPILVIISDAFLVIRVY